MGRTNIGRCNAAILLAGIPHRPVSAIDPEIRASSGAFI